MRVHLTGGQRERARRRSAAPWAGSDESDPGYGRSLKVHESRLAALPCPVVRLAGTDSPEIRLDLLERSLRDLGIAVPEVRLPPG